MRTMTIMFRGDDAEIIVDQYDVDYDTNALDVSWRFVGLTPAEHDDLHISDAEEDNIVEQIGERIHDD